MKPDKNHHIFSEFELFTSYIYKVWIGRS